MLQHKDALAEKFVLFCMDKVYQGLVRVFLRHRVCGVELAFDLTDNVDDLVCDLFSAVIHDFRHAGGRRVYQVWLQCLVVNVQDNWYLLLQELKHDFALIAESEKSEVIR